MPCSNFRLSPCYAEEAFKPPTEPRQDERKTTIMSDEFELFDLKVEVLCPPGEKIYCGAKDGDHFFLRGEMLHLPENQGFSVYSLCW